MKGYTLCAKLRGYTWWNSMVLFANLIVVKRPRDEWDYNLFKIETLGRQVLQNHTLGMVLGGYIFFSNKRLTSSSSYYAKNGKKFSGWTDKWLTRQCYTVLNKTISLVVKSWYQTFINLSVSPVNLFSPQSNLHQESSNFIRYDLNFAHKV